MSKLNRKQTARRNAVDTSTRPDGGPMLAKCDAAPDTARSAPQSAIVAVPTVLPIVAPAGRVWSIYQRAIFADAAEGEGHTVVRARAGTGKTTVICEALRHVPAGLSILVVAFNNKIKDELISRQARGDLPGHVDIKTCHGFGFGACMSAFRSKLANGRTRDIIDEIHGTEPRTFGYRNALEKAVAFAKGTLARKPADVSTMLDSMLDNGQIEEEWTNQDDFVAQIKDILNECRDNPRTIDFDDMVWLPIACDLAVRQYDRVFVDETQDLNEAQIRLALKACKPGGRICAVGDDRQAIYAFRGAAADALDNVVAALGAKVLPLSVTYRCASSIVDIARATVPDYEAAPNADAGEVLTIGASQIRALAKPGDFIISRKNAPLMSLCLAFLAAGVPATIAGRDIGKSLSVLIDKSRAQSISDLAMWLDTWQANEIKRISARKHVSDTAIDSVYDRVECINALAEGASSVAEVRAKIDSLFSDKDDESRIVLTTVHKAKGLERNRAFVLAGTFQVRRSIEEANLWYVAVTRARKALYICNG